ncbi:MAG: hypothetical protein LC098_08660 [Burkholderiales bacterium]|nr:hypothetical protein [Burkholderiales bacterium]
MRMRRHGKVMRTGRALLAIAALAAAAASTAAPPMIAGCPIFPANNIWNVPVDTLPVHANSANFVASIGNNAGLHMDFGSGTWNGRPMGIPFTTVPSNQPKMPISFGYFDESDPGPYPIPADIPIEGGAAFPSGDRHGIVIETGTCTLYETYHLTQNPAWPAPPTSWNADAGAVWSLNSHALRPAGWTSADAAGLPILPGLIRYDEVAAGEIAHALRFTADVTRRAYVWPARHYASNNTNLNVPAMGQRFRLKASVSETRTPPLSATARTILRAMKKYGIILADNGTNWYVSGTTDSRWNNDELHELDFIRGSDFEAVDVSSLMVNANSAEAAVGPITLTGTISGSAAARAGVTFCGGGAGVSCTTSDASGNFSCTVPYGYSGRLYPRLADTLFSPPLRIASATSNAALPTLAARQPTTCDLDADASGGDTRAFADGLLALRWMLGLNGSALTSGVLAPGATRTQPNNIAAHLAAQQLDLDGDSSVDATTDGLMLLRALLGFSGNAVVADAISPCATRTTWSAIRTRLANVCGLGVTD